MNPPALTSQSLARLSPLARTFYARDPRDVARDLLGKLLVRRQGRLLLTGRIVETEAYLGVSDPGAHAYVGRTPRNAVLFGPPGHAYVYFIYGNHYCTNISCQPAGYAGCVLLRALEPVSGIESMARLRSITLGANPSPTQLRQLTSGPGRLSQAMSITRERDNAKDLCSPESDLYITDDGSRDSPVSATPRVNVTRAPLDEWRYVITGNQFVSGKKMS
ncbi:MAG: DNA-3-methyladenine glycosylase [Acidobacteria bacterium]|nr:MAG: DNA-3-methyladenine glycosylase [Acidobacteriota bacterium]